MTPSDDGSSIDLDAAVVRSLALLAEGRVLPFADQEAPPAEVADWIRGANPRQTHGLLIFAIRRWHELQSSGGP